MGCVELELHFLNGCNVLALVQCTVLAPGYLIRIVFNGIMNLDTVAAPLVIVTCIFVVVCFNTLTNSMVNMSKSLRDIKTSGDIMCEKFRYKQQNSCPGCY
jgi:hypothetical protein